MARVDRAGQQSSRTAESGGVPEPKEIGHAALAWHETDDATAVTTPHANPLAYFGTAENAGGDTLWWMEVGNDHGQGR